jgi:predicted dehydrogenase
MTAPLRLGVAGLGEAATEFLPAYSRHPDARLVACADRRPVARERFARDFGGRAYVEIADLCADPEVEVVVVATNHDQHVEPTLRAAEAGKHVIVEKPMALTLEDCDAMIAGCERAGVLLLAGHSHSFDAPFRRMRELIAGGELGRLRMVNCWNFNDFMVRPYPNEHIRQSRGVVLNQGPHHVDIVRYLGGGLVRSVRATTGAWDSWRPGEGAYTCFGEFEDGAAFTLVYSGYGYFDTAELFGWYGEGGQPRQPGANAGSRRNYDGIPPDERDAVLERMKERLRYGSVGVGERAEMPPGWEKGGRPPGRTPLETRQPFFGFVLATCERGDLRQSPDGILVYDAGGRREVRIEGMSDARTAELDELYSAVREGRPLLHDGRWAKATLEVCFAMLRSAEERREVALEHQVEVVDGWRD